VKKKKHMVEKICHSLCPDPPDLLLDGSAGRIARERFGGWIRSVSLSASSTMVLDAHASPGGGKVILLVAPDQGCSLTPSTSSSSSR
jgi:hypothetical protein